jgi:hypothetical protein
LAIFGALSLIAVAIGCVVAGGSGTPMIVWIRNLASWGVGGLAAAALATFAGRSACIAFLVLAPAGLAASLWAAGLDGVHRWVDLGPLHVNVAQVLLPPSLVALGDGALGRTRWWLAAAALLLLVAQPDASQATAFGVALVALLFTRLESRAARVAGSASVGLAVLVSWLRPDPLSPVPDVEQIMELAWTASPLGAVAAWVALLGACAALMAVGTTGVRTTARALGAYAMIAAIAPLVGAFPVPLVGMTMSPILGLWLGAGLLAARMRHRQAVSADTPAASGA